MFPEACTTFDHIAFAAISTAAVNEPGQCGNAILEKAGCLAGRDATRPPVSADDILQLLNRGVPWSMNFFIGRLLNRGSVGIRIKSMNEPVRVMAIVGSYRRGGIIDQAVAEILASAGRPGASGGPP